MSTYKPLHLAHGILRKLADGPIPLLELRDAFETGWSRRKLGRKIGQILQRMKADGLAFCTVAGWRLTKAGREALADLDDGQTHCTDEPQGSIRIFVRAA